MFVLAETIFFAVQLITKSKKKQNKNEKRCNKTCRYQLSSYEYKKKEKKINQLVIKN
jgi:hypothetical protein